MTDPRKPIRRPDADGQEAVRQIVLAHLLEATEAGAWSIGCTGASFVIMGIGIWCSELVELDARATAQMLRAVADIYGPAVNDAGKVRAENKRRAAVNRLLAAVDLDMATPGGRA